MELHGLSGEQLTIAASPCIFKYPEILTRLFTRVCAGTRPQEERLLCMPSMIGRQWHTHAHMTIGRCAARLVHRKRNDYQAHSSLSSHASHSCYAILLNDS